MRAVTGASVKGKDLVVGLSLNNAPTVQDVWNTLPAWGYPYTSSALAPGTAASPIIGALAQNTLGVTAYALLDEEFYGEFGLYRSLGANFLVHAGIDPSSPGQISGEAPYGRIAYQKNYGDQNSQIGAFGLEANLFPGRDQSAGVADRYTDLGLDASYQRFLAHKSVLTINARYTHEAQKLSASQSLGLAQNGADTLQDVRLDASYYWHSRIGGTVQAFNTWGSPDEGLYGAGVSRNFRPDAAGFVFQLDGTPFGESGSPLGPRFNMRVGVQYTAFTRFNGATTNYDGLGHNAADNNTLRVFTWIAY